MINIKNSFQCPNYVEDRGCSATEIEKFLRERSLGRNILAFDMLEQCADPIYYFSDEVKIENIFCIDEDHVVQDIMRYSWKEGSYVNRFKMPIFQNYATARAFRLLSLDYVEPNAVELEKIKNKILYKEDEKFLNVVRASTKKNGSYYLFETISSVVNFIENNRYSKIFVGCHMYRDILSQIGKEFHVLIDANPNLDGIILVEKEDAYSNGVFIEKMETELVNDGEHFIALNYIGMFVDPGNLTYVEINR